MRKFIFCDFFSLKEKRSSKMETNESSYVPSPDVHGKRSTAPVKSLSSGL